MRSVRSISSTRDSSLRARSWITTDAVTTQPCHDGSADCQNTSQRSSADRLCVDIDAVERQRVGDAFERVDTAIGECHRRPREQILDCPGYEHLPRCCESAHSCGDVDGDPVHVFVAELNLTRVYADARLQTYAGARFGDGDRT